MFPTSSWSASFLGELPNLRQSVSERQTDTPLLTKQDRRDSYSSCA